MTGDADAILHAALALTKKQRAKVAERLIRSLDGPAPGAAEQAEIDAAWAEEIERRIGEIDAGTAKLISAEQVMRDARATLTRRTIGPK